MAEYVVAQASVLIVPSLDGFQKELKAELKAIQAELRRNALEVDVKAKGIPKMLGEIELAKQAAEEDPIEIKVDTVNVMKRLTEIRHEYEDLSREFRKGLVLDFKVIGMTLLPQLAQGLAAANVSMVQLVQTGLLLPGVFAGIASSVLAVVTGLGGVSEAFKEYGDAQKNAAQESLKARNSAKNVQNAYRDLGRSIKDAQRNLEDLNAQLRDAPLDEADAIIAVAEARAEAADKAGKSGLQQQKDLLALQKAENALVDTRLRNSRLVQDVAEANAKGVAGADAVRDATDRLAKAQDEAATQTTKLSDSLKKVSPNAQAFIQAVTGMDSQWTAFRNSVQDRLFVGLDQEIKNLATNTLPTLSRGFGSIADALNNNVKTAFAVFSSSENQGLLDSILGNTADAQGRLSKAFDPLITGFLRLSEAGSDYLPRLVDGLTRVLERFDGFIQRAESDGSLDKWINDGITAFTDLGNSIINLGSILTSISDAFVESGGKSMLQILEEATERLADFLKTDKGQQQLIDFFREARDQLEMWKPLFEVLPGMFSSLADAGQQVASIMMPWLTTAATLLKDHPALVQAAITAYLGWKTISPIVKGINNLFDKELITTLRKIPVEVSASYRSANGYFGGFQRSVSTLKDGFSQLGRMVDPSSIVFTAVSGFALLLGNRYMQVQQEAAQAAQSHADALRNISSQIDNVSGKLTARGLIDKLKELSQYTNINFEGDPSFNLMQQAEQLFGVSNADFGAAVMGDQQKYGSIQEILKEEIRKQLSTPDNLYSRSLKPLLDERGFSFEDMVSALAGDKTQADRFASFGNLGYTLVDVLQGYGLGPLRRPGLGDRASAASTIAKGLEEDRRRTQEAQAAQQSANTAAGGGPVQLSANNPFVQLGNPQAFKDSITGNVAITVDMSPEEIKRNFPALAKDIDEKGGWIDALASGSQITLKPDQARVYVPGMAAGGLVSGPGSGTSDSILTRLSHGEYVVNAKATKQHLPLLESLNGGNVQGFSAGGPVKRDPVFDGGDPSSDPGLPAIGRAISGAWDWLTGPSAFTIGPYATQPTAPYMDNGVLRGPTVLSETGGIRPAPSLADEMLNQGQGAGIIGGALLGSTAINPVSPKPVAPVAPPATPPGDTEPPPPTPPKADPPKPANPQKPIVPAVPPPPVSLGGPSASGGSANLASLIPGFDALDSSVRDRVGLAIMPLFGDRKVTQMGDLSGGAAWSTMKLPIALAAMRQNGGVNEDIVAAITNSDNAAADRLWASLGNPTEAASKVQALLREAGDQTTMVKAAKQFAQFSAFGQTDWSLENQLKFLSYLSADEKNAPILQLMSQIQEGQQWGLGKIPGAQFKGGWGPNAAGNYLSRQMGIIDGPGGKYAVAIAAAPESGTLDAANQDLTDTSEWLKGSLGSAVVTPTSPVPVSTNPVPSKGPSNAPIYSPQFSNGVATVAPSASIVQQLKDFAVWAEQLPYDWGGFGPGQDQPKVGLDQDGNLGGFDCSGLVLAAANIATGKPWNYGGRNATVAGQAGFSTLNQGAELTARGFKAGVGGPGTLTIGWDANHTGITLPDGTNIDAQNSKNGIVLGEGSNGANGFENVMHLPVGEALPGSFLSPSNLPTAMTPAGVSLPQFSFAPNVSGNGDAGASGGLRMPTPEEYAKYVTDSWQSTFENLVQNAGQIAIGFLGSFFGLDFSKLTGLANSVIGGIDLPGANDSSGSSGSGESNLPADAAVAALLESAEYQSLPPEYQNQLLSFLQQNPQNVSQGAAMLQQLIQKAGGGGASSPSAMANFQYDPNRDASQWRPVVRSALEKVAGNYGITNLKAWEDDIIGQIAFESRGNPNAANLNDTGGQQVFGIAQFLPSTFSAHNVTGGDISDPVAQIYAMIDYLASPKYGVIPNGGVDWKGFGWRNNQGYASGGRIFGKGSGTSDSILARVSNGEYIVRADAARKHMGLLDAINYGKLPGFSEGGLNNLLYPVPPAPPPPPVTTPPPPPSPVAPPPAGPQADAAAGMPSAPAPVTTNAGPGDQESTTLQEVGAAIGQVGDAIGGVVDGAQAPAGANPEGDPRSVLGAAPQNLDHNKPAVQQGITQAAGAIAGAVSTAISAAGAGVGGPAGGAAGGAASGPITSLITAGGNAIAGAVNILSSLGVGTVTPSTSTAGAYGAPLLPQATGQQPYTGPQVVNNWNGGVHTSNNEEFYKLQQRRELQNAAPYLPQR